MFRYLAEAAVVTLRFQTALAYEMVDAVESDQAYQDEVDGDDEV